MSNIVDFSGFPRTDTFFGGSERKVGILVDRSEYMLKFPKTDAFGSKRTNHVSEYLGSHIFSALNVLVQETHLGLYRGEEVVACRNFLEPDEQFVPFNDVGDSSLEQDRERYQYSYTDIVAMLEENRKLTNVDETVSAFWDMYIIDALLGNFDRHGANWGFIKKDNAYRLAPVFDNGSCLYPKIVDDAEMLRIANDPEEIERRIFSFPTSQIRLDNHKSSYYEIVSSLRFPLCNEALERICPRIDLTSLIGIIERTPFLSAAKRTFLERMLEERYRRILEEPYRKLAGL